MESIDSKFLVRLFQIHGLGSLMSGARDALDRTGKPEQRVTSDRFWTDDEIQELANKFEDIGLIHSAALLREWNTRRGRAMIAESFMPELQRRIEHEIESVLWLYVPPERRKYYLDRKGFGDKVATSFPSAQYDIEESGKCFALGRFTACVFHLMRVMEVALRALAKTLNDPRLDPKRNPSWDSILRKCREELDKDRAKRAPEWADDDVFFSGVAGTLMAVKDAWRNPTMHVEINYDGERALDVWTHVGAFMRHASTKLKE